jgi:hypothetical protein
MESTSLLRPRDTLFLPFAKPCTSLTIGFVCIGDFSLHYPDIAHQIPPEGMALLVRMYVPVPLPSANIQWSSTFLTGSSYLFRISNIIVRTNFEDGLLWPPLSTQLLTLSCFALVLTIFLSITSLLLLDHSYPLSRTLAALNSPVSVHMPESPSVSVLGESPLHVNLMKGCCTLDRSTKRAIWFLISLNLNILTWRLRRKVPRPHPRNLRLIRLPLPDRKNIVLHPRNRESVIGIGMGHPFYIDIKK